MPQAKTENQEDLDVIENPDGTVTINGSFEGAGAAVTAGDADDDDKGDPASNAEGEGVSADARPNNGEAATKEEEGEEGDDDGPSESDELATAKTDKEREEIRARRRQERKEKKEADRLERQTLRQENQRLADSVRQLTHQMAQVINRQSSGDVAQLEAAIGTTGQQIEAYKADAAKAAARGDFVAQGELLQHMQNAVVHRNTLIGYHQNLKRQVNTQQEDRTPTQGPDPEVVRNAQNWQTRNSWFNPAPKGNDPDAEDSRIAMSVDKNVTEAGFNPATKAYWDEMDKRLRKLLPHRYNSRGRAGGGNIPADQRKPGARSVVTGGGGGASNGSKSTFTLSAAHVQALKDAGMWDDVATRNEMIKQYARDDAARRREANS